MDVSCSTHGEITIYKILVGKPERENHSEDLGIDGSIILERNLRK
jgi:hypothetical protein